MKRRIINRNILIPAGSIVDEINKDDFELIDEAYFLTINLGNNNFASLIIDEKGLNHLTNFKLKTVIF